MKQFVLLLLGTFLWHFVLYFGSQYLEGEPHTVGWRVDDRIPFRPGFVYIYCSWFVLLLLVPVLLYFCAPEICGRYLLAYALDNLVSVIAFLLWPTTFTRPEPPKDGLTGFAMRTVYGCNHRFLNCAPSVHCSVSFLIFFAMLATPAVPPIARLLLGALSLAIVGSTLLVKQHVLLDALTAFPTALLCWLIVEIPSADIFLRLFGL